PAGAIGVIGQSMGAAATIYAAAAEPAIGAVITDCSFADIRPVMDREWKRITGLPHIFMPATPLASQLLLGIDMGTSRPKEVIGQIAPRPMLLIHGQDDRLVPVVHAWTLKAALPAADLWIIPGAHHVGGIKVDPDGFMRRIGDFFDRS